MREHLLAPGERLLVLVPSEPFSHALLVSSGDVRHYTLQDYPRMQSARRGLSHVISNGTNNT